jgi:hypothetical protein
VLKFLGGARGYLCRPEKIIEKHFWRSHIHEPPKYLTTRSSLSRLFLASVLLWFMLLALVSPSLLCLAPVTAKHYSPLRCPDPTSRPRVCSARRSGSFFKVRHFGSWSAPATAQIFFESSSFWFSQQAVAAPATAWPACCTCAASQRGCWGLASSRSWPWPCYSGCRCHTAMARLWLWLHHHVGLPRDRCLNDDQRWHRPAAVWWRRTQI